MFYTAFKRMSPQGISVGVSGVIPDFVIKVNIYKVYLKILRHLLADGQGGYYSSNKLCMKFPNEEIF